MSFQLKPRVSHPAMMVHPRFQKIFLAALTVMLKDDPDLQNELTDEEWRYAEELRVEFVKAVGHE